MGVLPSGAFPSATENKAAKHRSRWTEHLENCIEKFEKTKTNFVEYKKSY